MRKSNLLIGFLLFMAILFAQRSSGQTYLSESFEGAWSGTPAAPSGWSIIHTTATGGTSGTDPIYWVKNTWSGSAWSPAGHGTPTTPTGAYDGSSVAWYDDYNAKATQKDQLTTGDIDLSSSTNPRVTFYLALNASSSLTLKLRGSNDGGSTWSDIQTITKPGVAWTKIAISISETYKVSNARFGIEVTATYGSYDIWLDKFVVDETPVPLTGIKTIKSSGGDYATFTAAINALNDAGVGTGGITFNVDADFVSTEDCPAITATGTLGNPVVFQKSGSGANPVIKPTGGTGTTDAGIKIAGGDYITFDGIDITIATSSAVEYGYYLYNLTATNGAQNNTIKNSKITLNRSNTSSVGIYQYTATTPTNQSTGNNNNNKYYNITIENVYAGIYLRASSSTYYDAGCEVGITGSGTTTIGSSSANDIGNGSSSVYGIRVTYQSGVKIFNTTVRNITCTSSSNKFAGIFLENSYGTSAIYNNKIGPVTGSSTSSSTANYLASGMRLDVAASSTVNVYNNFIFGITTGQTTATTSVPSSVIQATGIAMGVTSGTSNVYYNSIRIEGSTFINSACIISTGGTANTMRFRDNVFANVTATQTGTPKHYGIMRQGSSGTINTTDYNDYYIPNTGNGFVGYYTADRAALSDWRTATSQDANSKSANPQFASATDLHSTSSDLNGAGVTISTANGDALDITTDIDGAIRGTPPDIGADEFVLNDQTSIAEAPTTQISGTTIASTVTTIGAVVEVFRFKITDMGSGDGLPTIVTNIRIQNANPANGASWTANIAGLKLNDGSSDITIGTPTITTSYIDIPVTAGNLNVPDASSTSITMSVYLKTSGIEDNKKLQFTIPATGHGFTADGSGSLFAADFGAVVTSNEHTITVTATKLVFSGVPASVLINSNFSATVNATDANGNVDIDNTASVTIARNTGTGTLSSIAGLTQSLATGTNTWTDLQYNKVETFKIQADGGSLTQAVSGTISCAYFLENFDGTWSGTPPSPAGWTNVNGVGSTDKVWDQATYSAGTWSAPGSVSGTNKPAGPVSGNYVAHYNDYNATAGQVDELQSPTIDLSTSNFPQAIFSYAYPYTSWNGSLKVMGYDGSVWTELASYSYTGSNTSWTSVTLPIPVSYKISNFKLSFKITAGYGNADVWLDDVIINEAPDMVYTSSTTTQTNTAFVLTGSANQEIIGVQIVTANSANPLTVTSFTFNTNGSTAPGDISNAKLWTTGTSSVFAATSQIGSTVTAPSGPFTVNSGTNLPYTLSSGTNYFWLTYDIASGATIDNVVDGECNSITVGGNPYTPTVQAPPENRTIKAALTGAKTVGNTGADYTSLTGVTGLFADINAFGLGSNLTVTIISDLTEDGANALNQWAESGAGNYTLTIQPSEAVNKTISGSYAGGLIRLNGADRVTIDGNYGGSGQYLTLSNSNTGTLNSAIALSNTANDNTIKNCKVYSKYRAITTTLADNSLIEGNEIYGDVTGNSNYSQAGIYISTSSINTKIRRNSIHDFYYTGTSGYGCFGIYYVSDATTETDISNNIIYNIKGDGDATGIGYSPQGIYIASGGNCKIYYNSIYLFGNTLGQSASYDGMSTCIGVTSGITSLDIRNNALQNSMGAYSGSTMANEIYVIYSGSANTTYTNINYNDYYFTNQSDVTEYIGYLGSAQADLAAWKTATSQDANSYSTNPNFTSATNLKPTTGSYLIGTNIPGITTDYEGATRSNPPDVGAFEGSEAGRWLGGSSTDWATSSNWDNGSIPIGSDNVVVNSRAANQPHVTSASGTPAVCNDLTINTGASLTIDAGKALTLGGTFTNSAGNSGMVVKSDVTGTGSLIHNTGGVNATVERYVTGYTGDNTGWHLLACPVSSFTVLGSTFEPTSGSDDLYWFDESQNLWINWIAGNFDFGIDRGYMCSYQTTATKYFTGALTNANNTIANVSYTPLQGIGWHLIPNPFPCGITWNSAGMSDLGYVSTASGKVLNGGRSYSDISDGGVIPAMNAFFMQVSSGTNSLTIPASAKTHSSTWYKSTGDALLMLTAQSAENTTYQENIIRFNDHATEGFDPQYDSPFLPGASVVPQMCSYLTDNTQLSLNTFPALTTSRVVPLEFIKGASNNYSIVVTKLDNFPNDVAISLEDTKTNITQDLRKNPVYTFNSSEGDNPKRFNVHFGAPNGVNEIDGNSPFRIYSSNNTLYISNNTGVFLKGEVLVYNLMGQQMMQTKLSEGALTKINLHATTGYYLVKVITDQKAYSGKIFIR
ncbi:MAG: T9SS type A sorting domain-containing protein [Bacteroidales bacterium]|jgi:hypothetical protein|nr:T9SS type A sorting domain-containing protein [Bacteroidales bacterium]